MESLARALGADAVRETHTSWVFLAHDRAYKLKKPVRLAFLDLSTPQARRTACEEEARVNEGGVVLGVRGLLSDLRLTDAGDPAAVDWLVEMRRFDEDATMAALLDRGELRREQVAAAARRVAAFHASAARRDRSRAAEAWTANLDELEAVGCAAAVPALRAFAAGFLRRRGPELDARAKAGLVRDGHGDLRADHVLFEDGRVILLDRLEFDARLRQVDVADDLAFLVMDLEARGAPWSVPPLVEAYRAAGGDPGDDALLAFFAAYRATVRSKVALLRAGDARPLLALAERIAWRARPPELLVVCGPPGSGKSTLAGALAERTGWAVLSSDAVRKERLGLEPREHAPPSAYDPAARRRVYEEIARRVPPGGAIVDATFGAPADRALMPGRARWIECRAPLETLLRRAAARASGDRFGSDADAEVAARLAPAFAPLGDVPHLVVDGTADAEATLRRIGSWLDAVPPRHGRGGPSGGRGAPRATRSA